MLQEETGLVTNATDGAGYISVDLAKEIAKTLDKEKKNSEKEFGTQVIYARLVELYYLQLRSALCCLL
jgi:hypothetical protein